MENTIEMTEQELRKSIEALVNEAYPDTTLTKSKVAKAEEDKEEEKEEKEEEKEEAEKAKKAMKKAEDDKEEAKEDKEEKEEDKAEKSKMKKAEDDKEEEKEEKEEEKEEAKKAKKSIHKSIGTLSSQEVELIHAWRAEQNSSQSQLAEEVSKSIKAENELNLVKSLKEAFSSEIATLQKSLSERDSLIKALSDKVEVLGKQPAYLTKSISNIEYIEKSDSSEKVIDKRTVTNHMLELQKSGALKNASHHIAEFESTGNISNQQVQKLVFDTLNK